jgi:hypothetical protein
MVALRNGQPPRKNEAEAAAPLPFPALASRFTCSVQLEHRFRPDFWAAFARSVALTTTVKKPNSGLKNGEMNKNRRSAESFVAGVTPNEDRQRNPAQQYDRSVGWGD